MYDSRTRMMVGLFVAAALIFSFGLGGATSYFFFQPARTSGQLLPQQAPPALTATPGTTIAVSPELEQQMQVFEEAIQLVQQEYYGRPIDTQKMIYEASKAALASLSDYPTMYVEPVTNQMIEADMRGNFEGIGAYVAMTPQGLSITSPMKSSPAETAGLQAGDIVTHVDGRDIRGMNENDVITLVRGTAGSSVVLTIQRSAQAPFDVTVTRATIDVPAVTAEMRPDGIGVLTVSIFGDKTTSELDSGLQTILAANPKGIILDVRNNGGGYVNSAEEMIGRFISPDTGKKFDDAALYYSYDRSGTNVQKVGILRGDSTTPHAFDVPMVVLVNGGTVSASEITAAALSDYGRAKLIGEQTYGKGSVQNVHTLSDGSSVRVTIAHWLSPNKRDINPKPTTTPDASATATTTPTFAPTPMPGVTAIPTPLPELLDRGLAPDIHITRSAADYQNNRDPQLDRAVQYLLTGQ